ncbi:peroxisome assembly factor 2 [Denticeps clupeoides]|uniref:peroxisome assembly factor 2 n=1 Tax=Denticeps clupeoides TaxID=299321 RepID=UPI0010A5820D|nr:peroxisome biogenesis factor 6 [Denticeps clupeoides]
MAAEVELRCLDPFPCELHPLQVLGSKPHFDRVFPGCADSVPALVLSPVRHQCVSRIMLSVHLTTEEETPTLNSSSGGALPIFTSKAFLRHHGLHHGTRMAARPVAPVGLSRVVLGARSRQSFRWAASDSFSGALLPLAARNTLLLRQGEPLLVPPQQLADLVVLECGPVTQGVVTVHTSVLVTCCGDLGQNLGEVEQLSSSCMVVSDFAHYAHSLSVGSSLLHSKLMFNSEFTTFMEALECKIDVRVVDVVNLHRKGGIMFRQGQEAALDFDSCLFVEKNLLRKIGLFNGEWVHVSALTSHADRFLANCDQRQSPEQGAKGAAIGRRNKHLMLVVVVDLPDKDFHDQVGMISPVLWFNLSNGDPVPVGNMAIKIKRWSKPLAESDFHKSESFPRSASPPFTKELHVEVVRSPEYSCHGPFDRILFDYFTLPRLVQKGAVFGVPTARHPEFLRSVSEEITSWPVLYFKVKKVLEGTEEEEDLGVYLADTVHTSLYMEGSTNTLAPWSSSDEDDSFWRSLSPCGLCSTVEHLVTIIQPHLKERCCTFRRSCTVLLSGPSGSGKVTAVRSACRRLHLHVTMTDCVTLCADTAATCEVKMKSAFSRAELYQPCVLLLRNLQVLGHLRDGTCVDSRVAAALCQLIRKTSNSIIVIATVNTPEDLSADVVAAFVHQVAIENPTEEQRRLLMAALSEGKPLGKDVNLDKIAKHTAGFHLADFNALLTQAGRSAQGRILKTCFPDGASLRQEEDLCFSGVTIVGDDFSSALKFLQDAHSHTIGAPKIPLVSWEDVGGLQQVKREILDTIQLPLEQSELVSLGLRRSGLLLYGPPGTGKTLLAKAVATECSMTFLSVKGPELINMYVGKSEENIREVFSKARSAAPCIIFFDELDSLAPNRGHSGDSGGLMDRVVSQLLAELDGLHSTGDVFVIGATNRPDLLDQSLLRPGRFEKLVYVGVNEDKLSQMQVLKAITRKFRLDPGVDLDKVIEHCPSQITGADIYALCSDAMMAAIKRKILRINEGVEVEDGNLLLCVEDFEEALQGLQPSVSEQELLKYKHIQQKFTAK